MKGMPLSIRLIEKGIGVQVEGSLEDVLAVMDLFKNSTFRMTFAVVNKKASFSYAIREFPEDKEQ